MPHRSLILVFNRHQLWRHKDEELCQTNEYQIKKHFMSEGVFGLTLCATLNSIPVKILPVSQF